MFVLSGNLFRTLISLAQLCVRQLYLEPRWLPLHRLQWQAYSFSNTPLGINIRYLIFCLYFTCVLRMRQPTGPINGGPFFQNDTQLRAIQRKHWHKICPEPITVWTQDIKKLYEHDDPSALTILNTWVDHLSKIDEPCVQIDGGTERVFDM
jgi:hypothetical protein